jgi:hypothetical protein
MSFKYWILIAHSKVVFLSPYYNKFRPLVWLRWWVTYIKSVEMLHHKLVCDNLQDVQKLVHYQLCQDGWDGWQYCKFFDRSEFLKYWKHHFPFSRDKNANYYNEKLMYLSTSFITHCFYLVFYGEKKWKCILCGMSMLAENHVKL